jgi:signal transduction histidine kinase
MPAVTRDHLRLLRWGGLAAWLMVGLPILSHFSTHPVERPGAFAVWIAAWLGFAAAFWVTAGGGEQRPRSLDLGLLMIQPLCVAALAVTFCDGFEGALLVLVAMQLASRVSRRTGLLWIAVQSVLLAVAISIHWSPRPALLLAPPYLGFQILALFIFEVIEREAQGRAELAAANAELRAAREVLAHGSRMAERLRIARELHDAVGHHLVALSLNLEVASHQAEGPALEQIRISQGLAKLLLTDVSEIVGTLSREEGIDLRRALDALTGEIPRPRIHLALPEGLTVSDPELAHLLLRCCQEIVTNAVKHAGAENLWIEVAGAGDSIEVRARDDGRGAEAVAGGRGLAGMRDRLESAGGRLEIETGPGQGFAVAALVPVRRAA